MEIWKGGKEGRFGILSKGVTVGLTEEARFEQSEQLGEEGTTQPATSLNIKSVIAGNRAELFSCCGMCQAPSTDHLIKC